MTLRSRASLLVLLSAAEVVTEEDGTLLDLPSEYDRLLGPDHTVTLGAHHNRAWALYLLGRYAEGTELMADVVARRERGLGSGHPFTVAGRQLLSAFTSGRGRLPEGDG
ncbi:tetratricopeptide repeat protein [Streptomyces sp. ME02-8801-2C]|uniref:tetratricopeptide repeat protein n=1 Tax=Streptomyces sp. ME02-8801-2C TaxID=3028680 RepID=UPI0029A71B0D|nr:tetratricopeptide repeat protein [Streptomyces sp. ME02-8801-2C]MDX3457799.1 tetratricopeptide repeat protein [Streptomyces sp. ME02-8801-2C]